MKSLTFVSNNIPYPPDRDGNTENIFHIVKALKEEFSISIKFIVFSKIKDVEAEKKFAQYVDELIFYKPTNKYLYLFYPIFYKTINEANPIFFCNFNSGYYQKIFNSSNKILYSADSATFYHSKGKGIKPKIHYLKYLIEESILYSKFQKIIFVSHLDVQFSSKRTKNRGIYVPIAYNIERTQISDNKIFDLIFSGNFDYYPNKEAAEIFLNKHLLVLLKLFPKTRICFVGRNPSEEMMRYATNYPLNVIVTGEVDSVEEYLGKAKIFISPLMSGSGMKNKILQAMAAKLPIVCTTESISGFTHYHHTSIIVSDDTDSMLKDIISLMKKNQNTLEKLGEINFNDLKSQYTWKAIVENYYKDIFNL